jgi:hypothetical protein
VIVPLGKKSFWEDRFPLPHIVTNRRLGKRGMGIHFKPKPFSAEETPE